MRTSILVLCLVILAGSTALAGYVIHDGTSGIIAQQTDCLLDSNGVIWIVRNGEWHRAEELYPDQYWWILPVPVQDIKWWENGIIVTQNDEYFQYGLGVDDWTSCGFWPDLPPASIEEDPDSRLGATVSPNPSLGSCLVSFRVPIEGEVSVTILDVSGRIVRHLFDGPHPAGDYRLEWDGTDDNGRELPTGIYLTRIETGEGLSSGRIVLAR